MPYYLQDCTDLNYYLDANLLADKWPLLLSKKDIRRKYMQTFDIKIVSNIELIEAREYQESSKSFLRSRSELIDKTFQSNAKTGLRSVSLHHDIFLNDADQVIKPPEPIQVDPAKIPVKIYPKFSNFYFSLGRPKSNQLDSIREINLNSNFRDIKAKKQGHFYFESVGHNSFKLKSYYHSDLEIGFLDTKLKPDFFLPRRNLKLVAFDPKQVDLKPFIFHLKEDEDNYLYENKSDSELEYFTFNPQNQALLNRKQFELVLKSKNQQEFYYTLIAALLSTYDLNYEYLKMLPHRDLRQLETKDLIRCSHKNLPNWSDNIHPFGYGVIPILNQTEFNKILRSRNSLEFQEYLTEFTFNKNIKSGYGKNQSRFFSYNDFELLCNQDEPKFFYQQLIKMVIKNNLIKTDLDFDVNHQNNYTVNLNPLTCTEDEALNVDYGLIPILNRAGFRKLNAVQSCIGLCDFLHFRTRNFLEYLKENYGTEHFRLRDKVSSLNKTQFAELMQVENLKEFYHKLINFLLENRKFKKQFWSPTLEGKNQRPTDIDVYTKLCFDCVLRATFV